MNNSKCISRFRYNTWDVYGTWEFRTSKLYSKCYYMNYYSKSHHLYSAHVESTQHLQRSAFGVLQCVNRASLSDYLLWLIISMSLVMQTPGLEGKWTESVLWQNQGKAYFPPLLFLLIKTNSAVAKNVPYSAYAASLQGRNTASCFSVCSFFGY